MLGHRKLDANDYIAILKRRRWLIIIPGVLLAIVAYGVTFFIPAKYLSQALVLIEGQRISTDIAPSLITQSLDSRLASMSQQVLSRSQIQPIIVKYNLLPSKRLSMDDRVEQVRKDIGIKPIKSEIQRTGGFPGFFVTFTASDPRTAQEACAEITELFLKQNLQKGEEAAQGTTTFLQQQVDDAKRNLDEHDAKLAAFQQKYVGKLPGQEASSVNMLTSLNTQLETSNQTLARMQRDQDYDKTMLAQELQNAPPPTVSGPAGTGPVVNTDYQQLLALQTRQSELATRYTPDYPDVVALGREIDDLKKKMQQNPQAPAPGPSGTPAAAPRAGDSLAIQQLRARLRAADSEIQAQKKAQANINAAIGMYQERIQASPVVEEEFKDLNRDYEAAQKNYDDLQTKLIHSKMAADLELAQQGEQFQLMDSANLPEDQTFPNVQLFIAGGLVGGLLLGVAIAAFLEYKDTSLRTEQDVWAFTQLPTLAVIAYAGNVEIKRKKSGLFTRLKGLFRRKMPTEMLSKAEG
jgi:polysaccharide chain length determinant protein (PEP-CTERM system associated)